MVSQIFTSPPCPALIMVPVPSSGSSIFNWTDSTLREKICISILFINVIKEPILMQLFDHHLFVINKYLLITINSSMSNIMYWCRLKNFFRLILIMLLNSTKNQNFYFQLPQNLSPWNITLISVSLWKFDSCLSIIGWVLFGTESYIQAL